MKPENVYDLIFGLSLICFHIFCVGREKIDGSVVAPDGPDSWPTYSSKKQWLVFYRINGLSMQGSGVIDGRGEKWWNLPCKPHKVYFFSHL